MNRFNELMVKQFAGCVLLYEGHDPHRNRRVKLFDLREQGYDTLVGFTDGVDSMVLPVSNAPLGVDIQAARDRVKSGLPVSRGRVRIREDEPVTVQRRAITSVPADQPITRKKLLC